MPLHVSLLAIKPSTARSGVLEALIDEYLLRSTRELSASARTFRTEMALLEAVTADRKGGATALWAADPGGRTLTSEAFAEKIGQARDNGLRHLLLAVGPADGWSADARAKMDFRLSLGAMTLPHDLARLVLAEQVYRATTILQGHPYHLGH